MVYHKAFETAGKAPGLEIWRIENMEPMPVLKELHGTFFTGDAYLLLCTTSAPSYYVHMWLGSACSQDESGTAAILATQLDDRFGGAASQFREVQCNESLSFLGYFKAGITYRKGGVASGFKNVVTNEANVKRLLHVKGRRTVRATEVDFSWSSFNKGDCFIVDLGKVLYHWAGSECSYLEKLKASQLAIGIRDNERNGRAKLHMVDEGSEPQELIDVLGPKPSIGSAAALDQQVEKSHRKKAVLYLISDATGSMKTSVVASTSPFKQGMLSHNDCYILDNGEDGQVFLWKGSKANAAERNVAMKTATDFIKSNNYSCKTQIQVLPAWAETTLFKQFFCDWKDKDQTMGPTEPYTIGRIARVEQIPFDATTLHTNDTMAAQHKMVDDGSGKVQIWRVEKGARVPVDPSLYGHFYGGDSYIILYGYKLEKEKHIIYIWQGLKSTKDEKAASAFLTVQLDDSMDGSPVQVRVTQGQEPPHLMSLFKGKPMIIHSGGTSRKGVQTQAAATRLFHIRTCSTKATRAVEVEPVASSLNSNDVFVLKTPKSIFVWCGIGATEEEVSGTESLITYLGGNATKISEGKEPGEFWEALGGKKEYQTSTALKNVIKLPRLFGCSNKTGRLVAEEVPAGFTQIDLATDDVMILDTWDQIFLWVGNDANEVEKTGAPKIAQEYVDSDPSGRRGTPITTIKQGAEPSIFTGWFLAWDPNMWAKDPLQRICGNI